MGIDCESNQSDNYYNLQNDIYSEIENVGRRLQTIQNIDDLSAVIQNILCFWGIGRIKAYYPAYSQGNFFENKVQKYIKLLWDEVKLEEIDWENAIEGFEGKNSIPIMTIHKSKGLEYDAVYFVGLEDSAFWNFKNQPEEDRCAFFVALSRAKKSITFTFCNYREEMRYPQQQRKEINEFFMLLRQSGMADVFRATGDV